MTLSHLLDESVCSSLSNEEHNVFREITTSNAWRA